MFDELILHGDRILQKNLFDEGAVLIPIRLPWYRSLPLEIIRKIDITIDDEKYTSENLSILLDQQLIPISAFKGSKVYSKKIWCNLDIQKVNIPLRKPLENGEHTVELMFSFELPYRLPEDPNPAFVQYVNMKKKMIYEKGEI